MTRMADLAAVNAYIDRNLERFLAEVSEICRIPSVGADEAAMADARRWLEARFTRLGFATRSIQWEGAHPYVFATASDGAACKAVGPREHADDARDRRRFTRR